MIGRDRVAAIWRLFAGRRRLLAAGTTVAALQALALIPIGALVHEIFDDRMPKGDGGGIVVLGAAILGLYVAGIALSLGARRIVLVATTASIAALRTDVLARMHDLPVAWHDRQDQGRLETTVTQEVERAEGVAHPLVALLQAGIVGLPLLVAAVVVSPLLAAMLLVVIPVMLGMNVALGRGVKTRTRLWLEDSRTMSVHLRTTLRTMTLIRARGADAGEQEVGRRHVAALARSGLRKTWTQSTWSVAQGAVAAFAGTLVLIVGGVAVAEQRLSLGELLSFYALTALLLRSVAGASGATAQLVAAAESLEDVQAFTDDGTPPTYAGSAAPEFDGRVALHGVTFGHRDEPILSGFDLEIAPGECVALVGPNGVGKSTVAGLLLGLHRPWSGTVTAGGRPLEELDLPALRRRIGVVPQEPALRPGTVAANIAFGRPAADAEDLARAVVLSGVDEVAAVLPAGLDTEVGDGGVLLSGGQRQRIALARALLGAPRLLVLDEPTNHLDATATRTLLRTLDVLDPKPSMLIITHETELAAWADRIVAIASGATAPALR